MKMIIALIRPERLEAVEEALAQVLDEGDNYRITVDTVEGRGRQAGEVEYVRGRAVKVCMVQKTRITIAVNDGYVEKTIEAIITERVRARSATEKSSSFPLEDVVRIAPESAAARRSDASRARSKSARAAAVPESLAPARWCAASRAPSGLTAIGNAIHDGNFKRGGVHRARGPVTQALLTRALEEVQRHNECLRVEVVRELGTRDQYVFRRSEQRPGSRCRTTTGRAVWDRLSDEVIDGLAWRVVWTHSHLLVLFHHAITDRCRCRSSSSACSRRWRAPTPECSRSARRGRWRRRCTGSPARAGRPAR